ncbi:LysR family transcriptional regulator [Ramlibacter tataouinensis]|uniref:Transcriptional regulator, LysR family-like protein n=1 Tax=Ramlibacter tataouinensis (strain ATCC BAA-407 / DSM 14655 / LMG 21543 / TTB310) TaxID=365046 RepID=F5XY39_RAMTT|nr:LysR family transcriptional regulator [Ramlibacter tataouinensis]AEG94364.1 transcriptional regulator, LysR family-like protein [Ramlibacter tataouinensis TTB310]
MNFRQLDLNLLRVLAAIHATRSVTAAGRRLALSQSATSNALARLRGFFGDQLFVRSPGGLEPTRRCEELAPAVVQHLRQLEALVTGESRFDLATTDMHWKLSLSDLGEMLFLPRLAAALRAEAPRARLSNISVAAADVAAALETREIDCAVGILQPRHRGVRAEPLFREQYVALASPQWRPPAGRPGRALTQAQLADAALVVASPTATFHTGVEQMLTRARLAHRIVLRARHFGALPELARATDLVAIVPEMYARDLGERYQLRTWRLADAPHYDVRLVWHASTERDPAHQWMRALLHRLFGRAVAVSPPSPPRPSSPPPGRRGEP